MAKGKSDTSWLDRLWDLPAALVLLTRLPLPPLPNHAFAHGARAVWAYPLVGLILGGLLAAFSILLSTLGLNAAITGGLILGALILLTGAMHEDGLADSADGLWGGHDGDRRLEIMKDSRIGAYGVLALIITSGLRWLGLAEVSLSGLVTALVLSRAAMPPLMLALPHARTDGLSRSVGVAPIGAVVAGTALAALLALILAGSAGLLALLIVAGVTLVVGHAARAKIGGQTGDILGATAILAEIAALLTLVAAAGQT